MVHAASEDSQPTVAAQRVITDEGDEGTRGLFSPGLLVQLTVRAVRPPQGPESASQERFWYGFRGLYDIEDRAGDLSLAERLELRQEESAPIMRELHDWLLTKNDDRRVLPKSSLKTAVRYALNQWGEPTAFLGDGALPIDNNETENELRGLTIGRQNWLFVGSRSGGETAASMYTLVSSASRHRIDVWAYVDDVLRQLAGGSTDYESLLPDRWRQTHSESSDYCRL